MTKEVKYDVIEAILRSWANEAKYENSYIRATLDALYAMIDIESPQEAQP